MTRPSNDEIYAALRGDPKKRKDPKKCCVENCRNHDNQGNGMHFMVNEPGWEDREDWWVCEPCRETFIHGTGKYSQVFRNVTEPIIEKLGKGIEKLLLGGIK